MKIGDVANWLHLEEADVRRIYYTKTVGEEFRPKPSTR